MEGLGDNMAVALVEVKGTEKNRHRKTRDDQEQGQATCCAVATPVCRRPKSQKLEQRCAEHESSATDKRQQEEAGPTTPDHGK